MQILRTYLLLLASLMSVKAFAQCGQLTTLYAGNNGQDGIMFDIVAAQSVVVTGFDIDAYGNNHNYEIYYKAGTHVGFENNGGAWALLGTANNVNGNPRNSPTTVPITISVAMCAGESHAFYVTSTGASGSVSYTNGTGVGNVAAADAYIQIREGTGKDYPYAQSFTPRIPNVTVRYDCTQSCCEPPLVTSTPTSCSAACDGSATASPGPGGVGPYTYQWDAAANDQTTPTATGLCAGTYTVETTDATGCTASSTVTVSAGSQSANATINTVGPFCENDAAVILTAAEGGGTWSGPGITSPSIGTFNPLVAGPGQHTITYSIPGTCGDSQTSTITVNPQADATIAPAGPLCLTGQPITLSAADPGGVWSGTGIINTNSGIFDPSVAGVGTWSIVYQITGSCGNFDTQDIAVQESADATIFAAGPFCENAAPVTLTTNGSGGTWSGTGITDPMNGVFDPSVAGAGSWSVTYTVPGNCGDSDDQLITVNAAADASISPAGPFCLADPPVNLTAAETGGIWIGTGITNSTNGTFNPASAGFGTWTIVYNIPGLCSDQQSTQITVTDQADAGIDPIPIFCSGDDPDTLAAADAGGTWSGPGIIDPILGIFDPSVAGTGVHTITYTLGGSCGDVDTGQANVLADVDATIAPVDTVCTSDPPFNFSAPSTNGFWGGVGIIDPFVGTFDPSLATPGVITINYSINAGFCSDFDDETFILEPGGIPVIDPVAPLCPFDPAFDLTADIPGGTWSGNGITDPATGTFNPVVAGPGQHTITYTTSGPCGETITETVEVTNPIDLVTSLDQQSNCGQSDAIVSVTASGGTVANDYTYTWGTTPVQNTATVSGLAPGVYTVEVTDDLNCSSSASVNVTSTPGFSVTIDNFSDISCFQDCDGEATVQPSAGSVPPLTYSWNSTPVQTGATATGLCPGSYDVLVTDNVGCSATTSVAFTEPTAMSVSAGATVSPICGTGSSSLLTGVSGGTPTYSYNWAATPADPSLTGNQQNPSVTPTVTTIYEVTVTDANGCTETATDTIIVAPALVINGTLDQESNCGQSDGIVSVTASGSFAPNGYTYSWNSTPIQNTATATGLAPGTYQVNVLDEVGCADSVEVEVTISDGFLASIISPSDMSCYQVCDGEATAEASAEAIAPLTYAWNSTPTQTGVTATGLCAGDYEVIITDDAGCTDTAEVAITEPAELTVTAAASETQLCSGETSNLTATGAGGTAPLTYNWTAAPADPSLNATDQNPTVSPTETTTYTVEVTDGTGCTATEQVTVDVSSSIALTASIVQESNCGQPDGSVTVTATGGSVANDYTYSWDSNPVLTTATATNLAPATYNVTVTDDLGCTATESILLTTTAGFTADIIASSDESCFQLCDGEAEVEASAGSIAPISYSWSTIPVQTTATATNLCAGTYDVTVTDNTGCSATTSVTISAAQELTATASSSVTQVCDGETADLTATANGGAAPLTYNWTSAPADPSLVSATQNPTVSPTASTTYTLEVTDANGCVATDQVTVDASSAIVLTTSVDQESNCGQPDGAVSVTASGGTIANDYAYSWDSNPAQTTATATNLGPATYSVTVTDDLGCSATESIALTSTAGFTATIISSNDETCYQLCDGEAEVEASAGSVGALTYSWNTTPVQTTAVASGLCPGNYDVTITDNTGCSSTASVTINAADELTLNAATSVAQLCGGETADLTATANGGAAPLTYEWTSVPADPTLVATTQNPTVSPTVNTTYTITVTDANGCTATEDVTIDASPAITLNASVAQQSNCGAPDGSLSVVASGGTVANDFTYAWDSNPVQNTATASNLAPGTYTVTVTDDLGCSETESILLTSTAGFTVDIVSSADESCFQACDGAAEVEASAGSVGALTYLWNTTPTQTTAAASGLCAGTYDVTITDNTGCSATNSVTILEGAEIIATATTSQAVLCAGQSADLGVTANGGTPAYQYAWTAAPADPSLNPTEQYPTISPTVNTVYSVIVTDANQCSGTTDISVDISPTITVTTSLDQQPSCTTADGIVSAAASGGTAANDFDYSWDTSPIQTTAVASNLGPGTYTVTVTDDVGCTATETITVPAAGGFLASITGSTDATCFQACDGTASADAGAGSTGPITYEWNTTPVQNTATAVGLCAGTYEVVVSDAGGCTDTVDAIISEPAEVDITAAATATTICIGASSDLSVTVNTGTQPIASYAWTANPIDPTLTANSQNPTVSPTVNTTYTVEVEDANGCLGSDQITIDVGNGLTLNTSVITEPNCGQSDGVAEVTASGGVVANDYTYSWNTAPVQTTATATGLAAGTYTVDVSDDSGCSSTATVDLVGNTSFTASITTPSDASCYQTCDGEATVEAGQGASGALTYSWNTTPVQTTQTATGLCAGTYDVTITDAAGCIGSTTVMIFEPAEFSMTATASELQICDGASTELSFNVIGGTAPTTVNWTATPADPSLNPAESAPTVSPTSNTTYTATATDNNGCTASNGTDVDVSPELILTTSLDQPSNCGQPDGVVSVAASGGIVATDYTYSWNTTPVQNTTSAAGLIGGTYTVTVTDDVGCFQTADITVTETGGFTASITSSSDALCYQQCDGEATVDVSAGSVPPLTYAWDSNPAQNTATATGLCAGNYTVTVTDAVGCQATANATIEEPVEFSASAYSAIASICIGESADISSSAIGGTTPYASYEWASSPADPTLTSTQQNQTVSPELSTTYTLTATDANGCITTSQVAINVLPELSLDVTRPLFGPDTAICPGESVTIDLTATGGDGNYTFFLEPDVTTPINLPLQFEPTSTTNYSFVVEDGCSTPSATAQSIVAVYSLPAINFSADELSGCQPLQVQFEDLTLPIPISWSWNFGDPQSNSNTSSISTPTHTFSDDGVYDISLSIETANGCIVDTTYANYIEVYPLPDADFDLSPTETSVLLGRITYTDQSTGEIDSWQWNFGTGDTSMLQNPQYTYMDTGVFNTSLTVVTEFGCESTTRRLVEINPSFTFYVPNAFTPNDDGNNDTFRGYGEGVDWSTYEMSIFNRWGEQIYYTNDIEAPWDGTFKGRPVEMATYVYLISLRELSGKKHIYSDGFSLVR